MEHFKQLKQVAEELNVTVSSLRGYVTVLEHEGYSSHIQRDSRNHRLFSEKNIAVIKNMIHLIKNASYTIQEAAQDSVQNKDMIHESIKNINHSDDIEHFSSESNVQELIELNKMMFNEIKALNEKIDEMQKVVYSTHEKQLEFEKNEPNKAPYEVVKENLIAEGPKDIKADNKPLKEDKTGNGSFITRFFKKIIKR